MNKDIQRAEEAKRLMAEPMMQEAFASVEMGLVERMKLSSVGDQLTHHELVLCLQLLGRVRRYFEEAIETGKMVQIQAGWNEKQTR